MNTRTYVAITGIAAILPTLTVIAALTGARPFGGLSELVLWLTTVAVGVAFAAHAFMKTSLSTESKVLWTVAMFMFFPFVSQFVYWARNICYAEFQHARFQKKYTLADPQPSSNRTPVNV